MTLRLFVAGPHALGQSLSLDAGAARHVQVRRMQPGETVVLFDGRGGEWLARITAMKRDAVQIEVLEHAAVDRELPFDVTLALGVPANERMDWLVEKATELGVARIRPLRCERSVLKLDGERALRKQAHWQAVAVAAAEQSGRTRVPAVETMVDFTAALTMDMSAARWMLSVVPASGPPSLAPTQGVVLLSGPEGGFSAAESAAALSAGWQPVHLGPRVLRAETAPLAVLAWLGLQR